MKTTTKTAVLLLLLTSAFFGCKKREGAQIQQATLTVKVEYPENYSIATATDSEVKLTSKNTGSVVTVKTNSTGIATFTQIIPGAYDVSVTRTLTATESFQLTGISQVITLNASKTEVDISSTTSNQLVLKLAGSPAGSLVIKEIYYTGSKTPSGGNYFSDQFIEIYNNSTEVIYLDQLCIADIFGNSGLINPNNPTTPFGSDQNNSFASNVWKIPGSGKQHPLNPGASIVVAQDGVNHKEATLNPASPVDLSKADWETYNERPDNRDADAPSVPNLEKLHFTGGFDWLITVFGPGIVIFRTDEFTKLEKATVTGGTTEYIKIPNALVIDAFEALKDAGSGSYKRVPVALDAGFAFATSTYTGESFRRKSTTTINGRKILQDTNNSGSDFEKLTIPTPKGF
ncbi:MAG: DUF4876 domain-containing protein [Pedobacter sp.]